MKWAQWPNLPNRPLTISLPQAASASSATMVLTTVCWCAFFCYSVVYCLFYTEHIDGSVRSVAGSAIWAVTEYGLWLLLAPALIIGLQRLYARGFLACFVFCCAVVFVANYLRVSLDVWLKPDANWVTSWVYFWPTQVAAACYSVLGWVVLLLVQMQPSEQAAANAMQPTPLTPETTGAKTTLTVQTGTSECEISTADIEYVMAAGNYMEVVTAERTYLLRETLKELQARLAPAGFVRSHRSYLVNREMVHQRTAEKLILRSGKAVPLSARFGKFL